MPAGQQQPATASVAGGAASLLREERWQAHSPEQRRGLPPLCAIALAPALGGQRFGAHLIQHLRRENSKKLKKASEYCQQNVGVGSGICQKLVKNISTVIRMHF